MDAGYQKKMFRVHALLMDVVGVMEKGKWKGKLRQSEKLVSANSAKTFSINYFYLPKSALCVAKLKNQSFDYHGASTQAALCCISRKFIKRQLDDDWCRCVDDQLTTRDGR